jgi:voltage-gated potassium channel
MAKGRKRRFFNRLLTSSDIKYAAAIVAFVLLSSVVVYLIEHRSNEQYQTFLDSVYWAVVTTATVGYGDIAPKSQIGRVVTIGIILFGAAVMGTFIGRISTFIMERQMKAEQGLLDFSGMSGHFLVCGWKREMDLMLKEIMDRNPNINPSQVVLLNLSPHEAVTGILNMPEFKGMKFVHGDFIEERELIRAGVKGAARVLVVADHFTEGELQQIDSKTVMAVMSIKNLNKRAYVCAEVLDTKFEKYLSLSHCDEVLLSRDFSRAMLSSAAMGTGITHVIRALTAKESAAKIGVVDIPDSFIGKSFREFNDNLIKDRGTILVGLLENTGNITDRKRDALREAQKNPDISKLLPNLKNAKTLSANDPVINPPADYCIRKHSRGIVITGSTAVAAPGSAA